jgi:hypothetical protein
MKNMIEVKSWVSFVFMVSLAGLLVTFPAHAQGELTKCPDNVTNPLELLQGTWAFNTAGTGLPFSQRRQGAAQARRLFDSSPDNPPGSGLKQGSGQPVASAGSFVASMDTHSGTGVLAIQTTTSRNGQIVELEKGTGSL